MLSNKMTFSLTFLVMLLAIGLVFAPSVLADGDNNKTHHDLDVTIGAAEALMDVSAEAGLQVNSGRNRMSRLLDLDGDGIKKSGDAGVTLNLIKPTTDDATNDSEPGDILTLSVRFSHRVNLQTPGASLKDLEEATAKGDPNPANPAVGDSGGNFGTDDIFVAAFDMEGRQLGVLPLVETGVITTDFIDASSPGRSFLVTIHQASLLNAYNNNFEISKLVFFIPKGTGSVAKDKDATVTRGIRKADLSHAIAHFTPDAHQHLNKASNRFEIELVDADQGDPQYAKIMGLSGAMDVAVDDGTDTGDDTDTLADGVGDPGSGTPGVVSIMRTASRTDFIETGDFQVRIILTEDPMGGLTPDKIRVENGVATSVVKGVTYRGGHQAITATTTQPAEKERAKRDSELGPVMIDYYTLDNNTGNNATSISLDAVDFDTAAPDTAGVIKVPTGINTETNGTIAAFPEATGRDNMYHSYIATISPNYGLNGNVIVSVNTFDDNVLPVPNRYIPVTPEQRDATRLTSWAKLVRDARVMNESITVRVHKTGDPKVAAATAAYDARQKVLDAVANEAVLENKRVVPAGGYLVLHIADLGNTGIVDPKSKIKEKISAASKLYYTAKLGLPFPADDLDNFFRNGGTLNLAYADISAATGSGHGDSKEVAAVGHDDDTGYRGATTNAYTTGALIINEIMWGLDGDSKDSQYIELYNPGTAAIGIDNKEWVITVGAPPAGYTVIDTVSNNPASGYWSVPGQGGLTQSVQAAQDQAGATTALAVVAVKDLISMSRITGAADGTAATSWAASMSPAANLSGRRIGTPGAPNSYVKPAETPAPPPPPPPATVPAATASDLRISEIMVSSNEGRLPQWIEIANVSAVDVSLTGWSISIDNDPADVDVVAPSINLKLGDVVIGEGQVALIVSKTGRNSGMDTAGAARAKGDANAGNFDADRIIDVQKDVSTVAKYSLISEMAFRISLIPPLPSGAVERGDVVGNLGMGWELEMSEGSRSSLIRREMSGTTEISGRDAAGWVLASDTSLVGAYVSTYYGDKDDMGTPGYNAGGALPVELSKFGAKRDPLTGQVVITWETQSELNNAGFYIKRAEHKTAQFVPVNPTMIPGAGTISEKRSYTYTDTTAKPNIVYYYQIEDVSLDGNRQTLTRAHRLKGHVGAAGKLTTLWGELKEHK